MDNMNLAFAHLNTSDFLKQPIHTDNPYELSYSILSPFYECERKFELSRLLVSAQTYADPPAYFVRGTAFGAGIQAYLVTGNMDFAIAVAWLAYTPEIEDLLRVPTISQARVLNNLLLCKDKLDQIRRRYRVAFFNGKPAIELSFKIHIDGKWYFIGHVDLVLFDTETRTYVVLENKTTTSYAKDLRPLYQNSEQALGYSIIIDAVVGAEENQYGALYFVCRDKNNSDFIPDIEFFHFSKTLVDRLRWFYTLKSDVERLNTMCETGIFPTRGHSCFSYGKVCPHFNFCHLSSGDVRKPNREDTRKYDFEFRLDDLINNHVGRIERNGGISG